MKFFCASAFAVDIKQLKKRPGQYGNVLADIGDEFSRDCSPQSILAQGALLLDHDEIKVLKIRVGNSTMKKGQRGGYRLIAVMIATAEECVFLHAYPKLGSAAKVDVQKAELLVMVQSFWEELEQGSLRPITFGPEMEIGELEEFRD